MTNDVILDRIPDDVEPRKAIPLGVKVAVLLRMLGFTGPVQWDHRPPIWLRKWNATKQDTVPPVNDPEYIVCRTVAGHDAVTNGPGGERRTTTAGGDAHARAHAERLKKDQEAFARNLLRKAEGEPRERKPGRRIGGAPMPGTKASGLRKRMDGGVERR